MMETLYCEGLQRRFCGKAFDSPTDSLLPGMKLGINHKTGQNWSLTSWFTASMPTPGAFTLEWIPDELQLVVKRRDVKYWTSGVLNNGTFKNLEILTDYNFTQVSNTDEESLTFKIVPNGLLYGPTDPDWVNVTSLSLEYDGTMVAQKSSGMFLTIYESCDGYNTNSGCGRWEGPKCRSHGEKFQKKTIGL
ncbi:hypothetical protein Dsin_021381 [Dipteronia sinensis]|uniref:Bulb-type lectin domain-containing protein n=1 Tax=Dipteronia sinensis TaxID=43782 RepID=A0AAE0DYY4_9ROSI|nr:hypothetical protein Dsin_021381 [Dipteronia sinensis]